MGNCQAAEAATVVIQHPGGNKVDRIYWSVSANEIMNSNPGHYVAQVVASPASKTENGTPVKQLKLLRPDDTLVIGQVYRLISFEGTLLNFDVQFVKEWLISYNWLISSFLRIAMVCADVLKEFAAKKCVKLGRLLKERGAFNLQEPKKNQSGLEPSSNSQSASIKVKNFYLSTYSWAWWGDFV